MIFHNFGLVVLIGIPTYMLKMHQCALIVSAVDCISASLGTIE